MDYEKIASQVHQFVKAPQQFLSAKKEASLTEINDKEIKLMQNATTKSGVSGNAMALETILLYNWA